MNENVNPKTNYSFKYFWRYFSRYLNLIIIGSLFLLLSQVAVTSQPVFLRNIINGLTNHVAFSIIVILLIYYFLAKIIDIISELLRDYFLSPMVMGVPADFEKDVFTHLLKLQVAYHANNRTGAAARAISRGSQAISFMLDFSVSSVIPPIIQLIFVTILLLKLYSWQYGLITFCTVVIYAIFTIWSTEKRNVLRNLGNDQDDLAGGVLVDSITNIDTVKYFNNQKLLFGRFANFKLKWFNLMVKNNRVFALIFAIQGLILLTGLGSILLIAIRQTSAGIIGVGDLVLLSTYIVQLSIPVTTLGFVYSRFKSSIVDLRAMDRILAEEITILEHKNPTLVQNPVGAVEFKNVSFGYNPEKKIIKNLSLNIVPGQKVALVGPSGAGKSTISKLIFRLYDVSSGAIFLSGIDVRNLSEEDLGKLLAVVPQDPALFNDTIENNIRFGKMDATADEVIKAAKIAQIHDFINKLPKGYQTLVGERGVKISGGERQRVAIARAIIKNPKILVFDEATSSLDSHNEQAVLKTIDSASVGRTSISIAHRLSTIVKSDIIFVLKDGQLAEQGNHNELLSKGGVYSKLWKIQTHDKE